VPEKEKDLLLSSADLEAIQARADAATQGPWHGAHDEFGCVHIGDYGWVCAGPNAPAYDVDSEQGHADAEFIAHARQDIPALLTYIAELEAGRDVALVEQVNQLSAQIERVQRVLWFGGVMCGPNAVVMVPVADVKAALDGEKEEKK
jgi:hypothetical protein